MNKQKLNIKQWSKADRPREKMMTKGSEALSDAELLGILIGSGNTEESAVELMRRILATCDNNLNELGKWEVRNFSSFKGMGPAKSLTIMAALELGKRRKLQESKERDRLRISTGGIDGTYADVRTILREALIGRATQIALIHNHPSGHAKPSQEDKRLTGAIQKASQTMNITLVDHVIVCDGCFYSFADEGLI